jgi:methionine synthase II (cobalamin-independent)
MTTATAVGSLPGTDPLAAVTEVLECFADLPYLPELPARGVGADAVGRSAGLLVDLPVELVAGQWQVAGRPGADVAAARAYAADDLAAAQAAATGYAGPFKVAVLGPVTLAANLGQARGEVALTDPGLRRDLTASLAEGVAGLLRDVRQRVPAAQPVLQLDEPSLPAVLAGTMPTRSGWGRLAPLDRDTARTMLADALAAAGADEESPTVPGPIVHCCARHVPLDLLVAAGARAVSFDLDLVGEDDLDDLGAMVEAGTTLVVGAVPTGRPVTGEQVAARVAALWSRLGFSADALRDTTVLTPACGLAGMSAQAARQVSAVAVQAAARLSELDVGGPK